MSDRPENPNAGIAAAPTQGQTRDQGQGPKPLSLSQIIAKLEPVALGKDGNGLLPDEDGYDAENAPDRVAKWCAGILLLGFQSMKHYVITLRGDVSALKKVQDKHAAEIKELSAIVGDIVGAIKAAGNAQGQQGEDAQQGQEQGEPPAPPMSPEAAAARAHAAEVDRLAAAQAAATGAKMTPDVPAAVTPIRPPNKAQAAGNGNRKPNPPGSDV